MVAKGQISLPLVKKIEQPELSLPIGKFQDEKSRTTPRGSGKMLPEAGKVTMGSLT